MLDAGNAGHPCFHRILKRRPRFLSSVSIPHVQQTTDRYYQECVRAIGGLEWQFSPRGASSTIKLDLNESMPKGTPTYGVPYPGSYVINGRGMIQSKYFAPDYRERYTGGNILLEMSSPEGLAGWKEIETPHLRLKYRASDEIVRADNHVALRIEVSLKR
jgi:hypothetical protein